jgi:hypothetical protein
MTLARIVQQHLPHSPRGNGEKMRAILPLYFPLAGEAQIGFMDDGSGLQRVARAFAPHLRARYTTQFVVYQGNELTGDILIARP